MKTKLDAAIDRICAGTITRETDALERLGAMTDDARTVVDAYSEAQSRIEALESVAKYSRHPNTCGYWNYTGKCTCGLAEAQAAAGV